MEAVSDKLSEATLFLMLLVAFLSHKLRWRDSTFTLLLAPALVPAIVGKVLVLLSSEPKIPLFLFLYSAVALALLVWGLCERQSERVNG